mgnify:CR=1 FL=1
MKNKKFTFEEKQKLIYGLESFGVDLLQQSELFLFGDSDDWALGNIRRTLVNIVCMAADRYGITTDYAKKEREEFLKIFTNIKAFFGIRAIISVIFL